MMGSLILASNFNEETEDVLIKIIATIGCRLQKEYDIAPQILESLLNNSNLITNCRFLHEQYLGEMAMNLATFKSTFK